MSHIGDEESPRRIWRRVLAIGLPSLGTVLLEPVLTSTDTAIIGHVSAVALGSLSLAASVLSLVVVPFTSLSFAVTTEASSTRAKGPPTAVGALGVRVWWGFGIMGIGLGLLLGILAPLVGLVAPNPEVGRGAEIYLWISCLSMPALCATQGAGSYLTGISRTSTVLLLSLGTAVFNVAVEVILVFGAHLSVAGSATGTALAQVMAALLGRAAIGRVEMVPRGRLRDAWTYLRDSMEVGRALVVRTLALTGAISGAVIVASLLSVGTLGGFQVGQQAWLVFGLSFDAIAVPAQVLIAEWHARGLDGHIAPWGRRLLLVGLGSSVLLGAIMIIARGPLADLYTSSPIVRPLARTSIVAGGILMPPAALSFVVDGLVSGMGRFDRLRTIMVWSFLGFFVVSVLVVANPRLRDGVGGVWVAFGTWLAIPAVLSLQYWRRSQRELDSRRDNLGE